MSNQKLLLTINHNRQLMEVVIKVPKNVSPSSAFNTWVDKNKVVGIRSFNILSNVPTQESEQKVLNVWEGERVT